MSLIYWFLCYIFMIGILFEKDKQKQKYHHQINGVAISIK